MKRDFLKFCFLFLFLSARPVYALDNPSIGPVNPAFTDYLESVRYGSASPAVLRTLGGHPLGWIPSTLLPVRSTAMPVNLKIRVKASYPASYDLRSLGKVTSVKNQGSCGDCWAFAALGSVESYLMPNENLDLSEADLDANSGFDFGSCAGGNDMMSAAYMTRWSGPLVESSSDVAKHAQNIIFLTPRENAADNDRIKAAVTAYGAVGAAFHYGDAYYNSLTSAYYADVSTNTYSSNHEVAIVGWDDNYSKANFSTNPAAQPANNGAFICKNSWGASWGSSGYFYVSYYDGVFNRDYYGTVFTGESPKNYARVYGYDRLGWAINYGYANTTAWYAAIFTAASNEVLQAAGFYTNDTATNYDLYVYTGVTAGDPDSGTLAYSGSGSASSPGFYTVPVGNVYIAAGQFFSVVVKAVNAAETSPIPVEANWPGYSSGAAASGNSYVSSDGSTWAVLPTAAIGGISPADVNIKAYSTTSAPKGTVTMTDNLFRPVLNPAVPCKIAVTIFMSGNVAIKAYTLNGKPVRTIYNGPQAAGPLTYNWDGKNDAGSFVASGVYIIRVKGPGTDETEKVVVIK